MNTLTSTERDLTIQAFRALKREATDAANDFDRSYGPNDFRSTNAWANAHARHKEIDNLAKKLGLPV